MPKKLPLSYFQQKDVVKLSQDCLGKVLCSQINGKFTSGIICETEAYAGTTDKASHAYGGKRTKRTETMYLTGGHAYVYLCYGIHHLFNIVSNEVDVPHAILIRGIIPLDGKKHILERRKQQRLSKQLCIGPGKVSQALGITVQNDGEDLTQNKIWIEDRAFTPISGKIKVSKRIGIDYAEEDAALPYRFECYDFQG